jgi:PAS domain S-box-containing protein
MTVERMLRRNEKLIAAVLESASQGILAVDREGHLVLANARTSELFGYTREELTGQPVEMLLPEAVRVAHVQHRHDYLRHPRVRPMGVGLELSGRRKDGTEFPVEISLSYVQTENGFFAIAFVTDITSRKQLEEQLLQSQKMEAVGRLAGGVAHDFNNMLTIISGYNRLLLNHLAPQDPQRGYAEEVLKAADRAAALTKQLLAFSRRQVMQPRVLNVNELLHETEKMLRRLLGEDIELTLMLQPSIGNVKADPGHIEQAIFNLAVNGRDAMPRGGRITIETASVDLDEAYVRTHLGVKPGRYIMIAVSDTGHGMSTETRRHIFEPFYTTKERGKGTGLGLATVYGIVKQSGGDIWVYSEPNKGTTFKLYFPEVIEPATAASAKTQVPNAKGSETLLVVEDEPGVARLITNILRQEGYTVLEATDSLEALQVSAKYEGKIDLVLTDVVMPNMGGAQLAAELRRKRPEMKVVYMSGYTENAIVHHGVLDSGVEFLPKPFTIEGLLAKIRWILDAA